MARAVRSGLPVPPIFARAVIFDPMPKIETEEISRLYNKLHPDRVLKFAEANELVIRNPDLTVRGHRHELRHDAESVFWLLLWWGIHACPRGNEAPSTIPAFAWTIMTTTSSDPRGGLLLKENCENIMDTQYDVLHGLLLSLAGDLRTDRYWATGIHADPEFIHEAFQ